MTSRAQLITEAASTDDPDPDMPIGDQPANTQAEDYAIVTALAATNL